MPTLIAKYYVAQTGAQGAGALTTPSFTPSNGEVIVIGYETWDTGTSVGAPTDSLGVHQTYTSRIIQAPGGFNPWVAKYTAVISGSPGSMTISSGIPSASARYSMVVERWGSAALAATPVTAGANGTTGAAVVSITPTSGTSVISWSGGDSQSLDPATRAYLGSGTDEGTRDDHVGSNGVGYHGYQASTGTGAQNVGLSAPTGMKFGIAAIEILSSGAVQSPAVQPQVITFPKSTAAGQQTLLRNMAALIVPPAKGVLPIVVTARAATATAVAILLAAPAATVVPATATPQPYVVTAPQPTAFSVPMLLRTPAIQPPGVQPVVVGSPAAQPASVPILLRNPQAPAVQASTATPAPIVVTGPAASAAPAALLFRGSLADAPVLTTPSPTVVTSPAPGSASAAILVRNPQAPVVAPAAATPAPIVVTIPAPVRPGQALLIRASLADAPVLTTPTPLVVTAPTVGPRSNALLGRNPQPFIPPVPGPTTEPIVVTAVQPAIRGLAVLIRSTSVVCDCDTHRPNSGVTTRPSSGITARPGSGTTAQSFAGTTTRPGAGTTARPCTCQSGG